MTKFNVEGRAPAPGILVDPSQGKAEAYRRGDHPLIRFQPTKRVVVPTSAMRAEDISRIEAWWRGLMAEMGPSPWIRRDGPFTKHPTHGTVIIWTFSGDLDVQDMSIPQFGDDCE